jgi:hypothetical protein
MRQFRCPIVSTGASLVLLFISAAGCTGSIYNWQVRTTGTQVAPSFYQAPVEERPVAIFPALSGPILRGTEVAVSYHLAKILEKLTPNWKVVDEQATLTGINMHGLGIDYIRMRRDAEDTHLLERESLRNIGAALGVRYIFQPRLVSFTQTMTQRWKVPGVELRVVETRSSLMRISLQLWDSGTGELIWSSVAEAVLANEAVTQDPVFLEDAARVTLGSLMSDFLNRRTASQYTPLNDTLNQMIRGSAQEEQKNGGNNGEAKEK